MNERAVVVLSLTVSWPHTTGFFECAEVYYEPEFGPGFMFEIVDGAVRCP